MSFHPIFDTYKNKSDFSVTKENKMKLVEMGRNKSYFTRGIFAGFFNLFGGLKFHFRNKVIRQIKKENMENFPGAERMRKVSNEFEKIQAFCLKKLDRENDRIIAKNVPKELRNEVFYAKVKKFEDRYEVLCHLRSKDSWLKNVCDHAALVRLFPSFERKEKLLSKLWEDDVDTANLDEVAKLFHMQRDLVKILAEEKFERKMLHGRELDRVAPDGLKNELEGVRGENRIGKTERMTQLPGNAQKWFESYINIYREMKLGGAEKRRLLDFIHFVERHNDDNEMIAAYFYAQMTEQERNQFDRLDVAKQDPFSGLAQSDHSRFFVNYSGVRLLVAKELVGLPERDNQLRELLIRDSSLVIEQYTIMGCSEADEIVAAAIRRMRFESDNLSETYKTGEELKNRLVEYAYDELLKRIVFRTMGEGDKEFATSRKPLKLEALCFVKGLQKQTLNKMKFMEINQENLAELHSSLEIMLKASVEKLKKAGKYDPDMIGGLSFNGTNLLDVEDLVQPILAQDIVAVVNRESDQIKWLEVIKKAVRAPIRFMQEVGENVARTVNQKLGDPIKQLLEAFPQIEFPYGRIDRVVGQVYADANAGAVASVGMNLDTLIDKGHQLLQKLVIPFKRHNLRNPLNALKGHLEKISSRAREMKEKLLNEKIVITGRMDLAEQKKPVAEKLPSVFPSLVDELIKLDLNSKPEELVLKAARIIHSKIDNGVELNGLEKLGDRSPVISAILNIFSIQALTAREEVKLARQMALEDAMAKNPGKRIEKVSAAEIEQFLIPGSLSTVAYKQLKVLAGKRGKIIKLLTGVANKALRFISRKNKRLEKIGNYLKRTLPEMLTTMFENMGLMPYAQVHKKFKETQDVLANVDMIGSWHELFDLMSSVNKMGHFCGVGSLTALDLYSADDKANTNADRLKAATALVKAHMERVAIHLCDGSSEAELEYHELTRLISYKLGRSEVGIPEGKTLEDIVNIVSKMAVELGCGDFPEKISEKSTAEQKKLIFNKYMEIQSRIEDKRAMAARMFDPANDIQKQKVKDALVEALVIILTEKVLPNVEIHLSEIDLMIELHRFVANADDQDNNLTPVLVQLLGTVEVLTQRFITGEPVMNREGDFLRSQGGRVVRDGVGSVLDRVVPAIRLFMASPEVVEAEAVGEEDEEEEPRLVVNRK